MSYCVYAGVVGSLHVSVMARFFWGGGGSAFVEVDITAKECEEGREGEGEKEGRRKGSRCEGKRKKGGHPQHRKLAFIVTARW